MKLRLRTFIIPLLLVFTQLSCEKTPQDFVVAVITGDMKTVQQCVEQGMDVNMKFSDGKPLIVYAAQRGRLEIVKYLYEQGAEIDYHYQWWELEEREEPYTPEVWENFVGFAMDNILTKSRLHPNVVRYFLEIGYDPNSLIGFENPILMYLIQEFYHAGDIYLSERPALLGSIQHLLEFGADPNYRGELSGFTPLLIALNYDLPEVVELLFEYGAVPSQEPTKFIFTYDPLGFSKFDENYGNRVIWQSDYMLLAGRGYTDILIDAIEQGILDPGLSGGDGTDCFYSALDGRQEETFLALLPYVKDVNAQKYDPGSSRNMSLLFMAARRGLPGAVKALLERGANPNLVALENPGQWITALSMASYLESRDVDNYSDISDTWQLISNAGGEYPHSIPGYEEN